MNSELETPRNAEIEKRTERSPVASSQKNKTHYELNYERRLVMFALAAGFPAVLASLVLLRVGNYSAKVVWTLGLLIISFWLGFSFALRTRVVRSLQTIANLLAALREGDYSMRARIGRSEEDSLSEVMSEINALGVTLREQRIGAMEATALLRTVMAEIDPAVFAFDPDGRLRLVNRAGERLVGQPGERLVGRSADELGLTECLAGAIDEKTSVTQIKLPGGGGLQRIWGVRRSTFRQHGIAHQLLVLADLSEPLRDEERKAWQRLVRVLGHELNNSLAPIKSIAGSLGSLLGREPRPSDWRDDMQRGLSIVSARAESLSRFMESYTKLARLPTPRIIPIAINQLVRRVVALETRLRIEIVDGEPLVISADGDQLEQLLINLFRNAVDAALVTGGGVRASWRSKSAGVEILVEDDGLGLASTANLFVPFYTTKPEGTGIGLVLCRQIAEAHGGTLTLTNRKNASGCEARLYLPFRDLVINDGSKRSIHTDLKGQ